jgi:hypothetical protein
VGELLEEGGGEVVLGEDLIAGLAAGEGAGEGGVALQRVEGEVDLVAHHREGHGGQGAGRRRRRRRFGGFRHGGG